MLDENGHGLRHCFGSFKDYSFFVPTEGAEGKSAVIQGNLFVDTLALICKDTMLKMLVNQKQKLKK